MNYTPVQREIFAADFRDRILHHLVYNYISPLFEKTFIYDSYSCRLGRGAHFGIQRIDHFLRSCSENYSRACYILKLDIRDISCPSIEICYSVFVNNTLKQYSHKIVFDLPLVLKLLKQIIFNDPTKNYILKGNRSDWQGLPKSKSLFYSAEYTGLPIGNLTSQLFSNIYLNNFDHFIKKQFGIKYYGRYVDDFVIIHNDKDYLKSIVPKIREYLHDELYLTLHPNKIYLQHFSKGVKFLGAVIKPHRIYIASRTKGNFYQAIQEQNRIARDHKPTKEEQAKFMCCMNSYLGIMKHYKSFRIRKRFIKKYLSGWWENYFYAKGYSKFERKKKIVMKS